MTYTRILVATGAACYLLFLVITFPAELLWSRMTPDHWSASGLAGTIWRGQASAMNADSLVLRDVRWRFQPFTLLRARAGYVMEARVADGFIQGRLSRAPGGRTSIRAVRAALPLDGIAAAVGFGGASGQMSVDLPMLELLEDWPTDVEGVIRIGNLQIAMLEGARLGDYELQLEHDGAAVLGRLRDRGGAVEIQAQIRLNPDRSYELQGRLRPTPDTPGQLRQAIDLAGLAEEDGWQVFGLSGRL